MKKIILFGLSIIILSCSLLLIVVMIGHAYLLSDPTFTESMKMNAQRIELLLGSISLFLGVTYIINDIFQNATQKINIKKEQK